MLKQLKYSMLFSFIVSLLISLIIVFIALLHNPQGEFYNYDNNIVWSSVLGLLFSWLIIIFVILEILSLAILYFRKKVSKDK